MACDNLTTGRARGCADSVGGLKAAYFSTAPLGAITYDADGTTVTTFAGLPEFFQYDLHGTANSGDLGVPTKDVNNGTTFFAQSLNLQFNKLTKVAHKELKLLMFASPTVIVQDHNGNYFVFGIENGMDVTGGSIPTGAAMSDLSGYTLTLAANEKAPANFLATDIPTTTATISAVQETP